jgi:hypothetical protein
VDFTDDLTNAIIEDSKILTQLDKSKELPKPAPTLQITKKEKVKVKEDLEKKPPLKPIHKRLLDIYSNKFQYVDLRFKGAKIKNVEVPVPKNLLPVKNETLKKQFKTKIKVFENPEKIKELEELKKLEDHLKIIRKNYLFYSKVCLKSILSLDKKQCFEKKIKVIEKKIPDLTDCLLEVLYKEQEKTQNELPRRRAAGYQCPL